MKRPLGLVCALWVGLAAFGCGEHERTIVLGPLPDRPMKHVEQDDAGPQLPDGAVLCQRDADCDDDVSCTKDSCLAPGYCSHGLEHQRCSDGVYCNGAELCDAKLDCLPALPPRCDDGDACTIDRCDEAQKACVHAARDFDHDGEIDVHCPGGTDCDDFDETRGARITEVCGNRIDDDCDDAVDEKGCGRASYDKCDAPLDVGKGGTFTVTMDGSVADYAFSCDADASRDVVFTFQLEAPKDVKLQAHGVLADGSEEIASLVLERACGDVSSDIECRRGFPSDLRARALPAGRYFVVATSYAARELVLAASFTAASKAPENTSCAKATDVSAGGRFRSDFVDVADSAHGCGGAGSPDLYYAFTLTETRDVELAAQSSENAPLSLQVLRGCAGSARALACDANAPAQMRLHSLAKGSYVVIVSGPASREVPFTLELAVLAPTPEPPGDSCKTPLTLALGVKQQVTLADKQDSVDTSCQRFGADAVLALHVPRAMDLAFDLDASPAIALLALQTSCGEPVSELNCLAGAPLQTRVRNVGAGDYFVVIEAPAAAAATVQVEKLPVTVPIVVADNATCKDAFDVPPSGGLFTGDTSTLLDDYGASCGGGAKSPDAVYRLVLDTSRHVVVGVDAEFDSVLYRFHDSSKTPCQDKSPAACNDDGGPGAQAKLDESLDPGTYYYVVDGFKDGNAGRYQLEVTITDK